MKKLFILNLLMFIAFQGVCQSKFNIGLSVGSAFNRYKLEVSGVSNSNGKANGTGYRLGLEAFYDLADNVGVYSGMALVGKQYKVGSNKVNLTVLEIPVGMRLRSKEIGEGFRVGVILAPTIDIRLSAKSKTGSAEVNVKEFYRTFGSSMKIGAMVEKSLDFGTAFAILSHNIGLSNASTVDNTKQKLSYFNVGVGFLF